jgi:hypothetical protein
VCVCVCVQIPSPIVGDEASAMRPPHPALRLY